MLFDQMFSSIPTRLLHIVYPFIYGFLYIVFSILFWADDHRHVIYPHVLDWNAPGRSLTFILILSFLVLPLLQLLYFGIYKLRLFLSKNILRASKHSHHV